MALPIGAFGTGPAKPRAPSPKPVAKVPVSTATGSNPRGVAITAPRPAPTVNDRAAQTLSTGANPRGVAVAQRPAGGQGVRQAVRDVFLHQSPAQQASILKGVKAGRGDAQTRLGVQDGLKGLSQSGKRSLAQALAGLGPTAIDRELGKVVKIFNPKNVYGSGGAGSSTQEGGLLASAAPTFGTQANTDKGALTVLKNTGKDIYNLPAGTVEGLYGVGKDIATGHEGNAFHAVVDPYVQLFENPGKMLSEHPINSLLMLAGPKAAVGRIGGAVARTGALGERAAEFASTAREPLKLGTAAGSEAPIEEARSYSPDVITTAMQKARESYLRKRGRNPNVSYSASKFIPKVVRQGFNIGQEAKLNRIADEMTAVRQMAGREERGAALNAVRKNAPDKDVQNIVSHVLQGVVRKPETAVEDIGKEINRLKAAHTGKRTTGEIFNRRQVRDLQTALKHPEKISEAFKAAAEIRQRIKAQDAYLVSHGLLDPEQAARRAVLPYAMAHMDAHYDPVTQRFVTSSGETLPTEEVLQHLKANGVPDPAYVGHFPGKVSPTRFYSTYKMARGSLGHSPLTGKAFQTGAYDHSFEGLAGQVASRAEAVTKASLHDRVVNRLGITMPKEMRAELLKSTHDSKERALIEKGLMTKDEANRLARASMVDDHGNPVPGALELTPISTAPAHVMGLIKDLQKPNELNHVSSIELRALSHAIDDAQHSTTRNVVLIPSVAAHRFAEQFAKTDSTFRSIGKVTQQFRRTVLPYSTHWMMQIGSEAGLRSLLAGALDPRYLRDGRALMKRLQDTEDGRAALMEMVNATFYNERDPLAIHNPNRGPVSAAAHAFPPTRAILAAHNIYANKIGHVMYTLEHNARLMGLGKIAHREAAEFEQSWKHSVVLQGQALDQLASKLKADPALVAKLGRQIDETFGKYNKFSPKVRAAVQSYAPFLPWYLSAAKYVLWNLPAHHPVASSLLAAMRQTVNQDMQDGKQAPLSVYAMQELARISPFGIFSPDSTTPSLAGAVKGQDLVPGGLLPEAQGALYNWAGLNSFGEGPLKSPSGDVKAQSGPALAAAAESLFESFFPGASKIREAQEGGKPAYGTSTILSPEPEPGKGQTSVANRIFNPLYAFERSEGGGGNYGGTGPETTTGSGSSIAVIPGHGSVGDAVIPGHGSVSGAVIP